MDPNILFKLKTDIESIPKIHHVKILQILLDNKIKFSENRNGIFVNMNEFDKKTVDKLHQILLYISEQEKTLNDVEKEKSFYQNNYFGNSNKDNRQ
jgi:hypothetical protein